MRFLLEPLRFSCGRPFRAVLLTSILLAGTVPALADDTTEANESTESPIVTDRPTDSASPLLVPRHTFQVEAGYKFTTLDEDGNRIDTQVAPDLLLRYGFSRRFEGRLVAAGWNFKDSDSGSEGGFTDVSLGAKFPLGQERGRRPQMGLLVDVSLPVGQSDFTSDYVIPKVLFLASHTLSERLALTYNTGASLVTSKDNGGSRTDADLIYAVALSRATGGKARLFGELYGAFATGSGRPDRHSIQAGTTILLSRIFQIDIRGGVGLVDSEPDWLFGAGLAFRLPF